MIAQRDRLAVVADAGQMAMFAPRQVVRCTSPIPRRLHAEPSKRRISRRPSSGISHTGAKCHLLVPCDVDRRFHSLDSLLLVGPEIGEQSKASLWRGRIDGSEVASEALGNLEPRDKQLSLSSEFEVELYRRVDRPPGEFFPKVAISIPAKVEACARPHLQEPQWQIGFGSDRPESWKQRGTPADLGPRTSMSSAARRSSPA